MKSRVGRCLSFALVTIAVGYSIVSLGGDKPSDSSISLLLIAAAALPGALFLTPPGRTAGADNTNWIPGLAAVLFPLYVAFQLIPLPIALVRVLSPARAELADALQAVTLVPHFVPLAIAPPTTWNHLSRVLAYMLVFLVVRELGKRASGRIWMLTIPLVLFGVFEAAWAFGQFYEDAHNVAGTYANKNHLAGLLEMVLPFALAGGLELLSRGRRYAALSATGAIMACALLSAAFAMFVAIVFSLSRSGVVAALGSLFVMAALELRDKVSRSKRWAILAAMIVGVAVFLVFLVPPELVERIGAAVTDESHEGRLAIWKNTVRLLAAYPLFGCGLGSFYPGILRYQTAAAAIAWVNAHNDYLQLLAELGVLGAIIPAALIGAALFNAIRAAGSQLKPEHHFLGLACAGGLTALLIHSFADFNTYVLANAMVLSWIAGIGCAIALAGPKAIALPRRLNLAIGGALLAFGVSLAALTGTPLLAEPRAVAQAALLPSALVEQRLELLKADLAAPDRWGDLGEALQKAHRMDAARAAFERSVILAPHSPTTLLFAADFHFDVGEREAALALVARAVRDDVEGKFVDAAAAILVYRHVPVAEVFGTVLVDKRSARAYLNALMNADTFNQTTASESWDIIVSRKLADAVLARDYTNFLLGNRLDEAGWQAWALYAKGRSEGYPASNRIFNGDFESDLAEGRFDWNLAVRPGVAVEFDREIHYSGSRSMRIRFDGSANVGDVGVTEATFLESGRYLFRALVRTDNLSTDEGVAFRLFSNTPDTPLDVTTDSVRGTVGWKRIERFVEVPRGLLVNVSVVRRPSLKFDNLVRGTAWIDVVSLARSSPESLPTR